MIIVNTREKKCKRFIRFAIDEDYYKPIIITILNMKVKETK